MNTIVVLLLAFAVAHGEFFTYDDCDPQCISRAVSCIIEEISKTYFPCECFKSAIACELHAKSSVVCLRPGMPALGGADIWKDNEDFHKRNGTRTTMRPTSDPTDRPTARPVIPGLKLGYAIIVVATVTVLGCGVYKVYKIYPYQRISNATSRQNLVYRETTHPLQEGML